jgi:hypothetical protein
MNATKTIKATYARNKFFDLINESYLKSRVFIIEKSGIPMVKIYPFTLDNYLLDKMPAKAVKNKVKKVAKRKIKFGGYNLGLKDSLISRKDVYEYSNR